MIRPSTHAMGRTLAALIALTATIAAQGAYDKLLTAADVEKVAGVYARKGNHGLAVNTFYPGIGEHVKPVLTEAQLKTIAQLIVSRE